MCGYSIKMQLIPVRYKKFEFSSIINTYYRISNMILCVASNKKIQI